MTQNILAAFVQSYTELEPTHYQIEIDDVTFTKIKELFDNSEYSEFYSLISQLFGAYHCDENIHVTGLQLWKKKQQKPIPKLRPGGTASEIEIILEAT